MSSDCESLADASVCDYEGAGRAATEARRRRVDAGASGYEWVVTPAKPRIENRLG